MNWRLFNQCKKHFWKCLDVFLWEEKISTCRDSHQTFPLYCGCCPPNEIKVFFSRNILNFLPKIKYSQLLAKKECSFSALILIHTKWNSIHIPLLQNRGNNSLKEEWLLVLNCWFSSYWQNIINLTFTPSLFQNILTPNIYIEGTNYDEVKCNLFRSTITNLKSSLIWKKYSKYIIGQLKSWKLT